MDNHNNQSESPLLEGELDDNIVNLEKEEEIEDLHGVEDQIEEFSTVKRRRMDSELDVEEVVVEEDGDLVEEEELIDVEGDDGLPHEAMVYDNTQAYVMETEDVVGRKNRKRNISQGYTQSGTPRVFTVQSDGTAIALTPQRQYYNTRGQGRSGGRASLSEYDGSQASSASRRNTEKIDWNNEQVEEIVQRYEENPRCGNMRDVARQISTVTGTYISHSTVFKQLQKRRRAREAEGNEFNEPQAYEYEYYDQDGYGDESKYGDTTLEYANTTGTSSILNHSNVTQISSGTPKVFMLKKVESNRGTGAKYDPVELTPADDKPIFKKPVGQRAEKAGSEENYDHVENRFHGMMKTPLESLNVKILLTGRFTESILAIPEENGLYREYFLTNTRQDGRVRYYRCSKCCRLRKTYKDIIEPKIKVLDGCILGDFRSIVHHEECKPITELEATVKQIDRDCRRRVRNGEMTPHESWIEGRERLVRHLTANMPKGSEQPSYEALANLFPSYKKVKQQYFRHKRMGKVDKPKQNKAAKMAMDDKQFGNMLKKYKLTMRGLETNSADETFLLMCDRGQGILVFASDKDLRLGGESDILCGRSSSEITCEDGKKTVYTVHAKLNINDAFEWVPILYAVIERRDQKNFFDIFGLITQRWHEMGVQPRFERFFCEFDRHQIQAASEAFGAQFVSVLYMDYLRVVLNTTKNFHLNKYLIDTNPVLEPIRFWVRSMCCVPLLPPNYVIPFWRFVLAKAPELGETDVDIDLEDINKQMSVMLGLINENWMDEGIIKNWNHWCSGRYTAIPYPPGYDDYVHKNGLKFEEPIHITSILQTIHTMQAAYEENSAILQENPSSAIVLNSDYKEFDIKLSSLQETFEQELENIIGPNGTVGWQAVIPILKKYIENVVEIIVPLKDAKLDFEELGTEQDVDVELYE
uniref:HTH psq-type domain-containing protein n=1 Tax=Parastrongyloides trichosuri TaxID=131310 RepID=A0A0N5A4W1_PARTI